MVHFITTFGCPLEIHSDQGANFNSNLFKSLCEILEFAKTRTTPYRPSSNGQVERYNTIVLQMIRCFVEKKNRQWDRDLPLLSTALHSMVNRQTGFTPNRLMLGRETVQPIQLVLGITPYSAENPELDPWVIKLAKNLKEVHQLARDK